jgi:hypothetical protein
MNEIVLSFEEAINTIGRVKFVSVAAGLGPDLRQLSDEALLRRVVDADDPDVEAWDANEISSRRPVVDAGRDSRGRRVVVVG